MVNNVWIINAPGPADFGKANVADNVGRVVSEDQFIYMDPHLKVSHLALLFVSFRDCGG
jgi:hypothetical protein